MDRTYPFALSLALMLGFGQIVFNGSQFLADYPLVLCAAAAVLAMGLVGLLELLITGGGKHGPAASKRPG